MANRDLGDNRARLDRAVKPDHAVNQGRVGPTDNPEAQVFRSQAN